MWRHHGALVKDLAQVDCGDAHDALTGPARTT